MYKNGEYDKAIQNFNKAIKLDPKDVLAYHNRGLAWYEKGDYDKAIEDFNKAIGLDSSQPKPYGNRARVWHEKGDCDKAIEDENDVCLLYVNLGIPASSLVTF